ncbi:MAG: histidine kinase [Stellaceae bacterium]
MPLRIRLIALITLALALSLVVGGGLAWLSASRSVRTEMQSALQVARQSVESGIHTAAGAPDWRRDLDRLVASFDGNRHVRVALSGDDSVARPPVESGAIGSVPAWFENAIGVSPVAVRIPVTIGGERRATVTVETVPHNEVLEVWDQWTESVLVLALFSFATAVLIYLFVGRALRPLDRLGAALAAIGRGEYGTRVEGNLPPELSRLRDSFNRMSGELAATVEKNRRLTAELLTLQEQERGDIARDLHDEVGPLLFGINVDAANISRALAKGGGGAIAEHLRSITDAVAHMQRQVRDMLGRLRPIGLEEFGLAAAIENLVEFWRRRHPEIAYDVAIGDDVDEFGESVDLVIYRIVQEGLSNAIRHGRPARIGIDVARDDEGRDVVRVADDGGGIDRGAAPGYGLLGMSERVKTAGGRFAIDSQEGHGLTVTAVLPAPRARHAAEGVVS